jgi:hypothetical protein
VVLFGGYGGVVRGTVALGETWLFNGSEWTRLLVGKTAPAPRGDSQMAGDPAGGVVLFGGDTDSGTVADTWSL